MGQNIKQKVFLCEECHRPTPRKSPSQKHCPECREMLAREFAAAYRKGKKLKEKIKVPTIRVNKYCTIIKTKNGRCKEYFNCPNKLNCIDIAVENDWPGWRRVA